MDVLRPQTHSPETDDFDDFYDWSSTTCFWEANQQHRLPQLECCCLRSAPQRLIFAFKYRIKIAWYSTYSLYVCLLCFSFLKEVQLKVCPQMSTYPMVVVQVSPEGSWDPLASSPVLSVFGGWSWLSAGPCSQQAPPAQCRIKGKGCICVVANATWQRCMGCHTRGVSQQWLRNYTSWVKTSSLTNYSGSGPSYSKSEMWPWVMLSLGQQCHHAVCGYFSLWFRSFLEEALRKRESSPFQYLVVYDPNVSFCAAGEMWLGCSA